MLLRASQEIDPMRLKSLLLNAVATFSLSVIAIAVSTSRPLSAAEQSADVPGWLRPYVGDGERQISQVVLQRARALYLRKIAQHAVKNSCYFQSYGRNAPQRYRRRAKRDADFMSSAKLPTRFTPSGRVTAAAAIYPALQISRMGENARRTSAMRWICSLTAGGGDYVTAEAKSSFKALLLASRRTKMRLRTARSCSWMAKAVFANAE